MNKHQSSIHEDENRQHGVVCLAVQDFKQMQNGYKKLNSSSDRRSQRNLTIREVKRLRLKRAAMAARQRLQERTAKKESLRQIPENNEAVFDEKPMKQRIKPPLDHAIESIYKDLVVEDFYEKRKKEISRDEMRKGDATRTRPFVADGRKKQINHDENKKSGTTRISPSVAVDPTESKGKGDAARNQSFVDSNTSIIRPFGTFEDDDSKHSDKSFETADTANSSTGGQEQELSVNFAARTPPRRTPGGNSVNLDGSIEGGDDIRLDIPAGASPPSGDSGRNWPLYFKKMMKDIDDDSDSDSHITMDNSIATPTSLGSMSSRRSGPILIDNDFENNRNDNDDNTHVTTDNSIATPISLASRSSRRNGPILIDNDIENNSITRVTKYRRITTPFRLVPKTTNRTGPIHVNISIENNQDDSDGNTLASRSSIDSCRSETVPLDGPVKNPVKYSEDNNDGNTIVTTDDSSTAPSSLIDMDMLHDDNNEKFEKILKEYEEQRTKANLAEETKSSHTTDNELYNRPINPFVADDEKSVNTYSSLDTFGFVRREKGNKFQKFEQILNYLEDQSTNKTLAAKTKCVQIANTELCNPPINILSVDDTKSVNTSRTLDTFGFVPKKRSPVTITSADTAIANDDTPSIETPSNPSLGAVETDDDSEDTPVASKSVVSSKSCDLLNENAAPLLTSITKSSSHNDAESKVRLDSQQKQEQEEEKQKESDDLASENNSAKSEDFSTLASKGRKLRALRLQAATNDKPGVERSDAQDPDLHFKLEEEEEKDSFAVLDYPGCSGQVIRVKTSEQGRALSVVSEITALSEKLFLKVYPKRESTWDDMSSVGYSVADQDKGAAILTCSDDIEYLIRMEAKELQGYDVEVPPMDYDASVKTPPIYYLNQSNPEQREQRNEKQEAIDDASSIGVVGIERLRKQHKLKPDTNRVASSSMIHFAVRPRPEDSDDSITDEEKVNRIANDIFRKRVHLIDDDEESNVQSDVTPTFSAIWGEDPSAMKGKAQKKSLNDTPSLELKPTYSTVMEDYDSYYCNSTDDMNEYIENSNVNLANSHSKMEDSKDLEIQVIRLQDQSLRSPASLYTSMLALRRRRKLQRQLKSHIYSC